MKQEITKSMFRDAFTHAGRKEQFSYNALGALYDYLEEALGEDYNLDVIALCCEFIEATLEEVKNAYPNIESFAELEEQTTVIPVSDGVVIYQQY